MKKNKYRKKVLKKIIYFQKNRNMKKREVTFFTKDNNKNIQGYSTVVSFRRKTSLDIALSKINFKNEEEKFYLILDLTKVV